MPNFKRNELYSLEQILREFGDRDGRKVNSMPVVVKDGEDILFIKFDPKLNPDALSKGELWIHFGEEREPDILQWAESGVTLPVFEKKEARKWRYVRDATAAVLKRGTEAQKATSRQEVALVIKMTWA